jgi:hypothetical protein
MCIRKKQHFVIDLQSSLAHLPSWVELVDEETREQVVSKDRGAFAFDRGIIERGSDSSLRSRTHHKTHKEGSTLC